MNNWVIRLRFVCILLVSWYATGFRADGQLTSQGANGYKPAAYINPKLTYDTIFAINQTPAARKGDLELEYRPPSAIKWERKAPGAADFKSYKVFLNVIGCDIDTLSAGTYRITVSNGYAPDSVIMCQVDTVKSAGVYTTTVKPDKESPHTCTGSLPRCYFRVTVNTVKSTFTWHRFDYVAKAFQRTAFATVPDVVTTQIDTLSQGGYMVRVMPAGQTAPIDSFVAWLYMNPGFDFKLRKDDHGAVYGNLQCTYTDFQVDKASPVVQSSFVYYNPANGRQETLVNNIAFTVRVGSGVTSTAVLRTQGAQQYFRAYNPPWQDTRYYFAGKDQFSVQRNDDIMYETIVAHTTIVATPPEVSPQSAPVDIRFTNQSFNVTKYLWRFGDGDSARYGLDQLMPDTVMHTYYTPKIYTAVLFVSNQYGCTHADTTKITVDKSNLDVANVFTPNGDTMNDYFKPDNTSIRQFEISIFTRAGVQVFQYKGGDLRNWQGWDGRTKGGKDAAEGVYFYVLQATGWDDPAVQYNKKTFEKYAGSIHLYR